MNKGTILSFQDFNLLKPKLFRTCPSPVERPLDYHILEAGWFEGSYRERLQHGQPSSTTSGDLEPGAEASDSLAPESRSKGLVTASTLQNGCED